MVVTEGVTNKFPYNEVKVMFTKGLLMLKEKDKEDSDYFKLRVIKSDEPKVWMIEDGQAITLLLSDEY
jgi:hypothetical protein